MKHSRNRRVVRYVAGIAVAASMAATEAPGLRAAEQRTGTHLESGAALPTVVHLNEPREIDEILALIAEGKNADAVSLASAYVERLAEPNLEDRATVNARRYFALNALCIALMASERTEEAIEQCSAAISLAPGQWAAWNSRGTTHFARQDFAAALADFERARSLVPKNREALAAIERNIELTRQRLAAD